MTHEDTSGKGTYMTMGLILGAAIGMAAGILAAPRSGAETRARMRAKAREAKERAREEMAERGSMVTDKVGQGLEKTSESIGTLSRKVRNSNRRTNLPVEE